MPIPAYLAQEGFDVRCEWGQRGIEALAPRSDALVIVDVLSFTTCVSLATSRGALVYPHRFRDESARAFAAEKNALLAGENDRGYSLRPASLEGIEAGERLVLPSPNGSTLSVLATHAGVPIFAGCLRNARAVAEAARASGPRITVIAAGEEWPDHSLRPAFEDWCGAGAVIAHLESRSCSPEAQAARDIFEASRANLVDRLFACASGAEKRARRFDRDVELAAALDACDLPAFLENGSYRRP